MKEENIRQNAVELISAIWRGINWDNVSSRRRMKIYDEFANKIKSSSMTNKLSYFMENLCEKMDSMIISKDSSTVLKIIKDIESQKLDIEILDIMRSETELIILMMRDINNELKENSKNAGEKL